VALVNSTTDKLKKSRLRERTDRAWYSRLVQHPARNWSGSILSTLEPARGTVVRNNGSNGCERTLNMRKAQVKSPLSMYKILSFYRLDDLSVPSQQHQSTKKNSV